MRNQVFKFFLVGIINNIVIYAAYILITHLGGTPKVTMTVLYVVSVVISFSVNAEWTFDYSSNKQKAFSRYIAAYMFGYGVNLVILGMFVDVLEFKHQYVQAFSISIVALILFLMNKYFVFKENNFSS